MRRLGFVALAGFVATVWLANWLLARYGIVTVPFGLMAPAGVYAAGLAFGLRDVVHELLGRWWVVVGIVAGAVLAWLIEDAVNLGGPVPLAVASGVAFLFAEFADLAVYEPLRDRSWPAAVVLSNTAGAVVDSALFLWLAFGSLDHLAGQFVGKTVMVAVALPLVWGVRRALPRDRVRAAGA